MKLDCTTDRYAKLYSRWLDDPGKLLRWAGLKPGERVLDLCGGTGAVALEAAKMGAQRPVLLDLNPRCSSTKVACFQGAAEDAYAVFRRTGWAPKFDLVVCRQAIGYLDLLWTGGAVFALLDPKGRFVFNTFREPRWALKLYRHNGRPFLEASGFLGKTVVHVQASPGIGIDVTRFTHHAHEDIMQKMGLWFDVAHEFHGRSARYICRHKPDRLHSKVMHSLAERLAKASLA